MSIQATSGIPAKTTPTPVQPGQAGGPSVPALPAAPQQPIRNAPRAAGSPPAQRQPSNEELTQAIAALQRRFSATAPDLEFTVDQDSGRSIIKVTDPATHEVIRQIPTEVALKLSKEIGRMQGLLLDRKA